MTIHNSATSGLINLEQIRAKQFSLALFDLDGTLIDSAPDLAAAVDHCLMSMNLPAAGESRVRSWIGNGAPTLIKRALAFANQCPTEALSEAIYAEAYQCFIDYYRLHMVVHTALYPGAGTLLHHWSQSAHLKMAIVTNKPGEFTAPICEQLDIARFFDIMYSGDSFPLRKPDPSPLQTACATLDIPVSQTIMIGDSINDLIAARRAGMTAVCVSYGYNHGGDIADHEPDVLVDSLQELM